MVTCNYCGEDVTVVYTCKLCRGKFCKNHRHPDDHDCSSRKSTKIEKYDTNIENPIEPSIKSLESELDYGKSNNVPVRNVNDLNIEERLDEPKEEILSENIKFEETLNPGIEKKINEYYNDMFADSDSEGISSITSFNSIASRSDKKSRFFSKFSILLASLLVVSLALSGFLYQGHQDYQVLYENYQALYNNTLTIQSYYNELSDQYTELREEYSQLNEYYSETLSSHAQLQMEYDDLINYELNMEIEEGKTITLGPKQNSSMIYQIPFLGYIDVSYNASGETYVWVGSTTLEEFYSRNPQFPGTASEHNFTIPVLPDVIIYFANPDEFNTITITYTLSFTY